MRSLLVKELRALLPMLWLIVGLLALLLGNEMVAGFPDAQRINFSKWNDSENIGSYVCLLLIFCGLVGHSLLTGEGKQGTLGFLDGLPVSRSRIYLAKIAAGLCVLAVFPLIDLVCDLAREGLVRTSLDGPWPLPFLTTKLVLLIATTFYIFSFILALSFLGQWFFLVLGLIFWAYLWLISSGGTWVSLFDPNEALKMGTDDSGITLFWKSLAAQAVATLVFFFLAWLGFQSLGDRVEHAVDRFSRHRGLRLVEWIVKIVVPIVWGIVIVKFLSAHREAFDDTADNIVQEDAFDSSATRYYEFLFRKSQKASAEPMIHVADEVYERTEEFFSSRAPAGPIVVDLASPVSPDAAGQTTWTKIRMPFDQSVDTERFRLILGHETVHVIIEQLSKGRLVKVFPYVAFFHEGMATYIETQLFGTEELREEFHRGVAFAWSRGGVPFSLLCDKDKLAKDRDEHLIYPLGLVFVEALIETHGKESIVRLLRAFGRKDAPMGLVGEALWRDTMQAAGIDMDRVVAAYDVKCRELLSKYAEFVAGYPRISADVMRDGSDVVIRSRYDGNAPGPMICVVDIESPFGPAFSRRYLKMENDGSFRISRSEIPGVTIRFMPGWIDRSMGRFGALEPWIERRIP